MKSAVILFLFILSTTLLAQSTTIKLPTTENLSSFNITNSVDRLILKLNADGGFYAKGSFLEGSIPIEGGGTRMMWYPALSAFRAGSVGTHWDGDYIGPYSTAFGRNTIASNQYSTAMGYNTTASGASSTAMGISTTASGDYSTAMGSYVSTADMEGSFVLGDHSTTSVMSAIAQNQILMRFAGGYILFTSSDYSSGAVLGAGSNSWGSVSDSTKKENFVRADGEYFLNSLSKLRLGSWNYKVQDPKEFRHYGPMAQEIFHYFGKDEYGVIGNDTSLATADMDGIMMICLQALEKRTSELKNAEEKIARLEKALEDFSKEFVELKKAVFNQKEFKEENKTILTVNR